MRAVSIRLNLAVLAAQGRVDVVQFAVFGQGLLVAAGEGAILAGQAEPHRECSMAVSGDSVAW